MLGEDRLPRSQQAEATLQLPPQGQQGRCGIKSRWQSQGGRCIAPGPSPHLHLTRHHPHQGILHPMEDGAVVEHQMASDRPQLSASLPVGQAGGLASVVATGHHHGPVQVVEDQVV